ncbi:hypothetical protein [Bacillus suaedae]|uniref:Uncharacterized protein n=1 Tax=Halalkalibacter suaedae TaxID=2822140 RepID=A0A941AN36_9BACI|nr:hypothetical protein [Bacillus suaedae]MBP3950471.1 hypothetical protein [Bacillus suaedae]
MLEKYLQESFGITKFDVLISPLTNKKTTIQQLLRTFEENGRTDNVFNKLQKIQVLGRKGVIVYLTKMSDHQ